MSSQRDTWRTDMAGLYARARHGDQTSVAAFDAKYRPYFLEIIRRRLHHRLRRVFDLEDLLQEFYLRIFAGRAPSLAATPLAQWLLLMRVCERTALSQKRRYLESAKRDLRRETHPHRLPERCA